MTTDAYEFIHLATNKRLAEILETRNKLNKDGKPLYSKEELDAAFDEAASRLRRFHKFPRIVFPIRD